MIHTKNGSATSSAMKGGLLSKQDNVHRQMHSGRCSHWSEGVTKGKEKEDSESKESHMVKDHMLREDSENIKVQARAKEDLEAKVESPMARTKRTCILSRATDTIVTNGDTGRLNAPNPSKKEGTGQCRITQAIQMPTR